jgi:hypothetical protein
VRPLPVGHGRMGADRPLAAARSGASELEVECLASLLAVRVWTWYPVVQPSMGVSDSVGLPPLRFHTFHTRTTPIGPTRVYRKSEASEYYKVILKSI